MKFQNLENILKHLSTLCWECNIDNKTIFDIAVKNYNKLSSNYTKNSTFIRLAGQSGSGKTTQLLPTAEKFCETKNIKPISLAVRKFASLHPNYNEILQEFGTSQLREKTNLFALKCLVITLALAISEGRDILLEVTYLTPEFEDFVNKNLDKKNYKKVNLVLAVNKEISNYFIEKRKSVAGTESGRVVYNTSKDFFYTALETSLNYYAKSYPNERVIIWDAYSEEPIYADSFNNCLNSFYEARKNISYNFSSEELLRNAKINFLLSLS